MRSSTSTTTLLLSSFPLLIAALPAATTISSGTTISTSSTLPGTTISETQPLSTSTSPTITSAPASLITSAALTCTNGSTVLQTTDCTYGTPTSYCYSPPAPITCGAGEYPSTYHPGHCVTVQTCYPTDASWLTTSCSNGGITAGVSTLYSGTIAGGTTAVVTSVSCTCATNAWYSLSSTDLYCLPTSSCPPGMTTSTSTNSYCETATATYCATIPKTTDYCVCTNTNATPVYPTAAAAVTSGYAKGALVGTGGSANGTVNTATATGCAVPSSFTFAAGNATSATV